MNELLKYRQKLYEIFEFFDDNIYELSKNNLELRDAIYNGANYEEKREGKYGNLLIIRDCLDGALGAITRFELDGGFEKIKKNE